MVAKNHSKTRTNLLPGSIERDLLKRHVGPFLFCFAAIMFLLLMQFLIQFMDHLVGKGIPLMVILELIMVNLAYMVVLAVPMTILAATLMAYGRFSEYNEYTALRAAGVHPFRIIRPVLVIAIIVTVFLGWFSNEVLPEANYKARALFLDIRMKKPGFDLQENMFYEGVDGYTFFVRHIPAHSDSLFDITLFQNPERGRDRAVIKARRGRLESDERHMNLTLHLYEGTIMRYLQPRRSSPSVLLEETRFGSYRITFDLADLTFSRTNPEERRRDGRSMSAQAMLAVVDSLRRDKQREIDQLVTNLESQRITFAPQTDALPKPESSPLHSDVAGARNAAGHLPDSAALYTEVRYSALTVPHSLEFQRDLAHRGILQLRTTQTLTDNLHNNLRWRKERVARFMVEVHKKAAIPFACILFALIGAPLGLLVRNGNMGVHAIISTVLFTYYWISIIQGEKMADRLFISPFTGMWFANFTMALAAAVLLTLVIRRR